MDPVLDLLSWAITACAIRKPQLFAKSGVRFGAVSDNGGEVAIVVGEGQLNSELVLLYLL